MADAAALQQYDEGQAKLRREQETGSKEDLRIEAPKPPEVNPELFKDVEPLLFRGMLHVLAEINGVDIVFKSLNHHEFERLTLLSDLNTPRGQQRFHNNFLAYGVLLVDGVNVLGDRDRWIPEIADMFAELEEAARRKVIRHLSEVNRRANRAVLLTEVYCLEALSRLRWAQYRGLDLMTPAVTGFQGTTALGLNRAQLTWRALNYFEDLRERMEREWENAKFVASAMAGSKGMSQVNSRDKQRREQEHNERYSRRDKILRAAVLGEHILDEDAKKGAPMQVARTVEELADQLEKDLKGEKDWHDQVVEAHEKRSREEYQGRIQRLQQMQQSHIEKYGPRPVVGGTDGFDGLTADEVKARITKRQQRTAERLAGAQEAFPEAFDPKLAGFMDKWAGTQGGCERKPREVASTSVSERPRVVPLKRGDV